MNSKLIILIILSFFSCKRAEDAWNEIRIMNETNDTLTLNISKKYISDIGEYFLIKPNKSIRIANATYISDFEIINSNWGDARDTIEIYRHDTLLAKWGAPLRNLPDSIHSFYNKNSWVIEEGGRKNKYIIATYTIGEVDFKKGD
jgi:hypothetical protein